MKSLNHTILYGFSSFCVLVSGQTLSDANQLYTDVFSSHQSNVIPRSNHSAPLNIFMRLYLMTINKFEEVDETLVVLSGVGMRWTDSGISWTPASYGNLQYFPVSQDKIWTPQIVMLNAADTLQPLGGDTNFKATVSYDGMVNFAIGDVLSAKCTPDVSKFPFDTQTCALKFSAWGYSYESVNFSVDSPSVDVSFFAPNSDWNLKSYSAQTYNWNGYSTYEVTLEIEREPLYYTTIVLLPSLAFSAINPLVFVLPVESGERIGFSTTVLLSYAIFLTLVSSAIPATSNPLSTLLAMMIVVILCSAGIVAMVIIGSNIYFRDKSRKMNSFWKFVGSRLPWKKRNITSIKPTSSDIVSLPECWENDEISWKDVSDSWDNICLIISYTFCIIIPVSIFAGLM